MLFMKKLEFSSLIVVFYGFLIYCKCIFLWEVSKRHPLKKRRNKMDDSAWVFSCQSLVFNSNEWLWLSNYRRNRMRASPLSWSLHSNRFLYELDQDKRAVWRRRETHRCRIFLLILKPTAHQFIYRYWHIIIQYNDGNGYVLRARPIPTNHACKLKYISFVGSK